MKLQKFNILKIFFRRCKYYGYVYCRVGYKGERSNEFSTTIKCTPLQFANGRFVGKHSQTNNALLDKIRDDLNRIYLFYESLGEEFRAEDIKNVYVHGEERIDFEKVFDYFLEYKRQRNAPGHYKNLVYKVKRVREYLAIRAFEQDAVEDWVKGFEVWLMRTVRASNDHFVKIIEMVKHAFGLALKAKKVRKNPFSDVEVKRDKRKKPIEFLSLAEVEKLERIELFEEKIDKVRDVFLFQCYTGFAYNELKHFDYEKNVYWHNERCWVRIVRGKTQELTLLPMPKKAFVILEKYQFKLPVEKNDDYNAYLKQLFGIANMKRRGYTHLARKTAGHYWINKLGLDYDTVAAMLGHSSSRTTREFYARVVEDRIEAKLAGMDW